MIVISLNAWNVLFFFYFSSHDLIYKGIEISDNRGTPTNPRPCLLPYYRLYVVLLATIQPSFAKRWFEPEGTAPADSSLGESPFILFSPPPSHQTNRKRISIINIVWFSVLSYAAVTADVKVWIRCEFCLQFCHKVKVHLKVHKDTVVFNFSDFWYF